MDVTVVVATFGDVYWMQLANRAARSVVNVAPTVTVHAATLHDARNEALDYVETEWVIYLDADDELEPGYIDRMATGTADVRAPSVRYVRQRKNPPRPRVPRVVGHQHDCTAECLAFGNWVVIGAAVRADLVRSVGGWRDFDVYEDWDLWARCWQAGATFEAIPSAIYRAHVRPDSRNRGPSPTVKHATHQAIARANGLPVPA